MADDKDKAGGAAQHPGMMGDGTEEQNLGQPGDPAARITEDEVTEAFGDKSDKGGKPAGEGKPQG